MRKEFEYKGQMINYYNKVKQNEKVVKLMSYLEAGTGKYVIEYEYKKN